MTTIGQAERTTQNRVIALFRDELRYRYLGDRTDRPDNSNIAAPQPLDTCLPTIEELETELSRELEQETENNG